MIYIVQGSEECFIKDKINEIIKDKDFDIFRFDGTDKNFDIDVMLEACNGSSLFSSGSIVLVNEPNFLIKKVDEKNLSSLMNYVNAPAFETELIFYTYNNNFNSKLKTYKDISNNAQVFVLDCLDYKNFNNYVGSRLKEEGLNLSNDLAYQLNTMCKRSATLLNRNIEILKLYPDKITAQVISKLCSASDDNDSFDLVNALTAKDVSKSIDLTRKMISENDSALGAIGLLATQLRFLYQVAYYKSLGKRKNEIIDLCNSNEGRINRAYKTLEKLNLNQISELLYKLSDFDIKCKSDYSIADNTRMELFILELLK